MGWAATMRAFLPSSNFFSLRNCQRGKITIAYFVSLFFFLSIYKCPGFLLEEYEKRSLLSSNFLVMNSTSMSTFSNDSDQTLESGNLGLVCRSFTSCGDM